MKLTKGGCSAAAWPSPSQARKRRFTQGFLWSCGPTFGSLGMITATSTTKGAPCLSQGAKDDMLSEMLQQLHVFSARETPRHWKRWQVSMLDTSCLGETSSLGGFTFYVESSIGINTHRYLASVKMTKPHICSWDVYKVTMVDGCNQNVT